MQKLLAVGCLLLMAGVVSATPTTVDNTISSGVPFGINHWSQDGTLSWLHTVSYGAPPVPGATLDLLSASLTITAYSVESTLGVKGDTKSMGNLGTGSSMQTIGTVFTVPAGDLDAVLMDGQLNVAVTPADQYAGDMFKLISSKLSVTYDWILPPPPTPPEPPAPVVPAPAGLVLAGIGTAVIGWLRRHQCL